MLSKITCIIIRNNTMCSCSNENGWHGLTDLNLAVVGVLSCLTRRELVDLTMKGRGEGYLMCHQPQYSWKNLWAGRPTCRWGSMASSCSIATILGCRLKLIQWRYELWCFHHAKNGAVDDVPTTPSLAVQWYFLEEVVCLFLKHGMLCWFERIWVHSSYTCWRCDLDTPI